MTIFKREREREQKWLLNTINEGDGLELLRDLKEEVAQLVIFDPQYKECSKNTLGTRKYQYDKGYYRSAFHNFPNVSQNNETIKNFVLNIERILKPSGFLLIWVDRDILLSGKYKNWLDEKWKVKEILIWQKKLYLAIGNLLFCNQTEYCLLIQKKPWNLLSLPKIEKKVANVFSECLHNANRINVHQKPFQMTQTIIQQLTQEVDLVVDPCAGSFTTLRACQSLNRNFLGTDLTLRALMKFNINKERSRELLKKEKFN